MYAYVRYVDLFSSTCFLVNICIGAHDNANPCCLAENETQTQHQNEFRIRLPESLKVSSLAALAVSAFSGTACVLKSS